MTGDSFVVDVRAVSDVRGGASYVAKYAAKGWSREVSADHDSLIECMTALRGRRLISCVGSWRGIDKRDATADVDDWTRVGRLDEVIESAGRQEAWAVGVLRSLNASAAEIQAAGVPAEDG